MTTAHTETFDLLIIGGGLAGLPLAIACGGTGMKVAVVDAAEPDSVLETTFDGRVSALNRSTYLMLDRIGVWPHIEGQAQPIQDIRVVDGDAPIFLHFDHREGAEPGQPAEPFGFMVENRVLRKALDLRVREMTPEHGGTVHRFAPNKAKHVDRHADYVIATLENGTVIQAPLVVAADGRFSHLRTEAGIPSHGWSYNQTGIVLAMHHEHPHNGTALERFRAGGPFAVLPMVDDVDGKHQSGIVWCEEPDLATHILSLDDTAFKSELERRVGDYLGELTLKGPRWSFPLALNHAKTYVDHRLALIGDAAHAMHPVAGQGLNLGLRDVASLAEILVDTRRVGLDIGRSDVLKRYDQSRRVDAMALMGMTDGLTRLFSTDFMPISAARKIGLAAVQRMTPLKTFFTRHATRGSGDARTSRLLSGNAL